MMFRYANSLIHSRQSTIDTWNSVWSLRHRSSDFVDKWELVNWYQGLFLPVPVSPQLGDIWSREAGWHRTWVRMAWCRGWWAGPRLWPASPCAPAPAWPALSRLRTSSTRRKSWVRLVYGFSWSQSGRYFDKTKFVWANLESVNIRLHTNVTKKL